MKKSSWFIIWGIIIVAIILRFWQLGRIPAGFHADEVAYGYNAYSLLKTGRDEYGKPFPLIMKSFSDYKAAVYSYLAIPFIATTGLNEWAVRAPSAVFGVLFVMLTYALVLRMSRNQKIALLSMVFAAISPLGILLSRVQSDPLVCVTFFYFAVYCWFIWLDKRQWWYIPLIFISIFLSFYTYTVTRIFSIPFLLLVGAYGWRTFDKKARIVAVGIFAFVAIFVAGLYVTSAGSRFSQVSIFSKMDVQLLLEEELREDGVQHQPLLVSRILHNKATAYARYFLKNYTDYLSFDFLFLQAKQPLREQVPNMGVLLLVELPFLLAGIYAAIKKRLSYGILSILWVVLVPAVLSIASDETPNIHRFFLAMMPIHALTAVGGMHLYQKVMLKYRVAVALFVVFVIGANMTYSFHQLFVHQPAHAPIYRNDEYTKLAHAMKNLYPSYDVIVSQKILEHILFYWPIDPATYQKEGSPRDTDNARYGKFFFVTEACPSTLQNPKVRAIAATRILYVDKAECNIDPNDRLIQTIQFDNSLNAYYLVEKTIRVK